MTKQAQQIKLPEKNEKQWYQNPSVLLLIFGLFAAGFETGSWTVSIKQDLNEQKMRCEFQKEYDRLKTECSNAQAIGYIKVTDPLPLVDENLKKKSKKNDK